MLRNRTKKYIKQQEFDILQLNQLNNYLSNSRYIKKTLMSMQKLFPHEHESSLYKKT